jgi:amidase
MADELATLDATAQAELVRSKQASPLELVDAAIARIERVNPQLNAVIHTAFELARDRAKRPDLPEGPFRGVPLLMKDIGGAEAGQPCHSGSRFLKALGYTETQNSYTVERLRDAGFVSLGRTNTPELAILATTEPDAYGPTRNPWDLTRSSGGSSGGASAAVASGLVPVAHASDGGGSIRGPASMCGLVGLKPTRARGSFGPSLGERWSGFSCELVLSRSVRDTAALLDVMGKAEPGDPYVAPPPARAYVQELGANPGKLRIGVMRQALRDVQLDPECVAAVDRAARALEGLGHHVEEAYPSALDEAHHVAVWVGVVAINVARALAKWAERAGRAVAQDEVEPHTWALAQIGGQALATQHLEQIEYVHGFGRRLAAWWQSGFDLLLTPTQAAPPPPLGHLVSTPAEPFRALLRSAPYGVFTLPWNMSGQPAISLPGHITAHGLPVGVQLVAATAREDLLLRVASQLELAAPWSQLRAPVYA